MARPGPWAARASLALSLILAALAPGGCEKRSPAGSGPGPSAAEKPPPGALELVFTYGSEKEKWIREATDAFNAAGHKLGNIRSLSELAVSRHEPQFISGQIDQVATSVVQTERTLSDLQFVTGLSSVDEEVPGILRRKVAQADH